MLRARALLGRVAVGRSQLSQSARHQSQHRSVVTAAAGMQFWAARVCPYAQRGYIALKETGVPFEFKSVDLHDKSPEFVELYRRIVCDDTANAKVPVLIDGELKITESPVVAEYVLRRYGADTDILPAYPAATAKAKLWAELFGANVGAAQVAILKSDTKAKLAEAEEKMVHALTAMDAFLRSQGSDDGGSFFLGKQYSIAEVLTTSLLQRALAYTKAYRGVDLWRLVADAKLARLEAWMKAAMERPSAKETAPDETELLAHGRKFTVPMEATADA
ncbi:hypothetical protein D9Q98_006991 [Chlorella vulgaris]|uniref:Glutathione S-transferase n=1 Tax=Chlorella vulgaris TaxID=3077 RepID=A0A9D4TJ90_CHLVU|nr:hypothetical protein D9Q98_006991 [Chlorella vulgaris]